MMPLNHHVTRCGYIAIIGRSNVGKSTLLNAILGEKLCITSRRLQTTRHNIIGIKTRGDVQAVYVDTPGLQQQAKRRLNQVMNQAAQSVWHDVDVIAWVVDIGQWRPGEKLILQKLGKISCPVLLLVNKIDLISDKKKLLPKLQSLTEKRSFAAILPISAKRGDNIVALEKEINQYLPLGPHLFADDQLTDRRESFMIAELVREKILRSMSQEIPHQSAVMVEKVAEKNNCMHIDVVIWVERKGQKAIIIGKSGEQLKNIGRQARLSLQHYCQKPVMLKLWVKVKRGWSDKASDLQQLSIIADAK